MAVPTKLVQLLEPFFNPDVSAEEQGREAIDIGFDGNHEWFLVGLWQPNGVSSTLSTTPVEGTRLFSITLWVNEPYETVFSIDESMLFSDDDESALRLVEWVRSKAQTAA